MSETKKSTTFPIPEDVTSNSTINSHPNHNNSQHVANFTVGSDNDSDESDSETEEEIEDEKNLVSIQKIVHVVDTDDLSGTLRVGILLKWMDTCACLAAERLSKKPCVTVSMDDLAFESTAQSGSLITIEGRITRAFRTSMEIEVVINSENLKSEKSEKVKICSAFFTFVSIVNGKRVVLPEFIPRNTSQRLAYDMALERRAIRLNKRKDINTIVETSIEIVRNSSNKSLVDGAETIPHAPYSTLFLPPSFSNLPSGAPKAIGVAQTKVQSVEILLPSHTQHHGTAFGGQLMAWAVELAFISAFKICDPVFHSIDDVNFIESAYTGDRILISAKANRAFEHMVEVEVQTKAANVAGEKRNITQTFVTFTFEKLKRSLVCETEDDRQKYHESGARRKIRMDRMALRLQGKKLNTLHKNTEDLLILANVTNALKCSSKINKWDLFFQDPTMSIYTHELYQFPTLQVRLDIECSAELLHAVISDSTLRPYWDPIYDDSVIIHRLGGNDCILCQRLKKTEYVEMQELLLLQSQRAEKYLNAFSSVNYEKFPKSDNITRTTVDTVNFQLLKLNKNKCSLYYTLSGLSPGIMVYFIKDLVGSSKYIITSIKCLLEFLEALSDEKKIETIENRIQEDYQKAKTFINTGNFLELTPKEKLFHQCRVESKAHALKSLKNLKIKYGKHQCVFNYNFAQCLHDQSPLAPKGSPKVSQTVLNEENKDSLNRPEKYI